jgi:transposase
MTDFITVQRIAGWEKLKTLVLDSVSSSITKRVYNMALDEFLGWFQQAPRTRFTKATVSAWRVQRDPLLAERIKRLRTVPGVGPITALTWALEIGDVSRFRSVKQAISYCGLCGDEKSSADKVLRTPLSKQRNKHIQSVLVEAAKLAPRQNHELALVHEREKQKGNANRATLAVARKMVAYLLAVDRREREFVPAEGHRTTAA